MDVKRVIGLTILLAAVLVAGMVASLTFQEDIEDLSPAWLVGPNYTGTVKEVDKTSITIATAKGPVKFQISTLTRTTLIGNVPVEPDTTVRVTYRDVKTHKDAKVIRVVKLAPGAPGAAPASPGTAPASPGAAPASPGTAPASPGASAAPAGASGPGAKKDK